MSSPITARLRDRIAPFKNLIDFARDPIALFERHHAERGDLFEMPMAGQETPLVCVDPKAVKELVAASYDDASRYAGGVDVFIDPLSLILLDDEPHRAHRRLLAPGFGAEAVRAFGGQMHEICDRALDRAPVDRPFEMVTLMQDITMRVILRCLLGVDEGPRFEELRRLVVEYMQMVFSPEMAAFGALATPGRARAAIARLARRAHRHPVDAPFTPSSLPYRRIADRLGRIQAILDDEIARRRARGVDGKEDVLSRMIAARFDDGAPLAHDDLVAQLFMLLIGGYETTSITLCWAVHCLIQHPAAVARVRDELADVMGEGFDPARVRDLPYLAAAIQESMRLHPIAVGVSRRLRRPYTVAGRALAPGTIVMLCIYLTQRSPALWDEPAAFRPERMLERRPSPHAFFPFGVGVWRCLGAAFAEHEMRIVLARLVARFDLEAAPGPPIHAEQRSVTAAPSGGLPVILRRRRERPAAA